MRVCVGLGLYMCYACLGSCLKDIETEVSSLWGTSWAISARAFRLNVHVLFITIGMIFMFAFRFACS